MYQNLFNAFHVIVYNYLEQPCLNMFVNCDAYLRAIAYHTASETNACQEHILLSAPVLDLLLIDHKQTTPKNTNS